MFRLDPHHLRVALPTLPIGKKTLGSVAIASGFVLCWSSGFVGSRLAVGIETSPLGLYTWRFGLATLLIALWWGLRLLVGRGGRLRRSDILMEAASGSLTMGIYLLAMLLAVEQSVSAGVASLIGALQPLMAATLAAFWLREYSSRTQWIGMSIATLGAGLCVLDDMQGMGGGSPWAYGLPLIGVVAVTLGSMLSAKRPTQLALEGRLTIQLAAATLVFLAASWGLGEGLPAMPALTLNNLSVMAFLIVLASFGGYGFFVTSLKRLGVTATSTLIYLTPALTLVWTAVMFGELPGGLGFLGMGIASVGVIQALAGKKSRLGRPHANNESQAGEGRPVEESVAPASRPPQNANVYASRAKIRSQTPWPRRSPRSSNLVKGRKSGRET
ncbi:DMT family transporter [Pistricoccus aurantiacus]|uniref:DMT family transporter n=1 Tax=Pistricoccus aurantiacus TaxID=1883414 RepID=A0A5B8STX2_9GAMM|nr:DMT family transporter [Pistricoccus aurantiacus]QEA38483.1 DMT family transporter [Pistricoccus aurantiacus]